MSASRPRVVVVGAGFGGMAVVRGLADAAVDIVLIDRTNHHLFQPLLYQVATAALSPAEIASPVRSLLSRQRNVEVQLGTVDGVDPVARTVSVRGVGPLRYDQLVLATGSEPSWFGHDEWRAHSTALKTLLDASRLRERLLAAFELAERASDPAEMRRLLTFVVVGGGASGVELAGSIRELADATLKRDFRRIEPAGAQVLLFEGGDALLSSFPKRLSDYTRRRLERMGVTVRTGTNVESVDEDGISAGGERIRSANVFWCAGVAATQAAAWLGVRPGKHGAVPVDASGRVADRPGVFAIGDVAAQAGQDGQPLPGVAPVAEQQGKHVARCIAAAVSGRPAPGPFRYRDQGSLAVIGRSAAVADLPFAKLTGLPAWVMWGGVHLLLLNGLRNRVLVYVQWFWAWLTYARGARLIEGDLPHE